jgi:hypothetical protein
MRKPLALSETRRREIFKALVEAQDSGSNVVESRKKITKQFGITEKQLDRIEQAGIDGEWPPLQ